MNLKKVFSSQVYFVIGIGGAVAGALISASERHHAGVIASGIAVGVVAAGFIVGAAIFAVRDR